VLSRLLTLHASLIVKRQQPAHPVLQYYLVVRFSTGKDKRWYAPGQLQKMCRIPLSLSLGFLTLLARRKVPATLLLHSVTKPVSRLMCAPKQHKKERNFMGHG
jgi:hypothetical protein